MSNCTTTGMESSTTMVPLQHCDLQTLGTAKSQTNLCVTLAQDCIIRVRQCEATIQGLLNYLAEIIANDELQEISEELWSSNMATVDKIYTQNILTRNNSRAKPMAQDKRRVVSTVSPTPKKRQKCQTRDSSQHELNRILQSSLLN